MYLAKNHDHFDVRVFLISPHVIHESCSRVPVPSYSHALIHPICGPRDDVVQFIGHATRTRHISNAVVGDEYKKSYY